jgi:hypothetical protein
MSRHSLVACALAALVPLTGCELFAVETEIPELCVGFNDRLMPGAKGGSEFERTVLADPLKTFGAYVALDAEITEARATLRAKTGVTSLAFIDSLSVSITPTTYVPGVGKLSLVSCEDYACASDTMESTVAETPPQGIMDVIESGQVELEVRMTGDLPEEDWVVDIEVCVSGKARAAIEL